MWHVGAAPQQEFACPRPRDVFGAARSNSVVSGKNGKGGGDQADVDLSLDRPL